MFQRLSQLTMVDLAEVATARKLVKGAVVFIAALLLLDVAGCLWLGSLLTKADRLKKQIQVARPSTQADEVRRIPGLEVR